MAGPLNSNHSASVGKRHLVPLHRKESNMSSLCVTLWYNTLKPGYLLLPSRDEPKPQPIIGQSGPENIVPNLHSRRVCSGTAATKVTSAARITTSTWFTQATRT